MEQWVCSKVVVGRVFIWFVINQLITKSIDWCTAVDPGKELIIQIVFTRDLILHFFFGWYVDGSISFVGMHLFMVSCTKASGAGLQHGHLN